MATDQFFYYDADQRDDNLRRFLSSPEAKGIITPQSNRSFHERANLINKSAGSWLYITTVASWTRALYEILWKPRTKLINKEQRQEIKAIKIKSALDKKTKRDEKRECAKRKREQTMQKLKENRAAKHKQKEDKKRETQPDTRKPMKRKQEIRKTIRDSLLSQKREKKLKWDQAIQRLKEDRAAKQTL